MKTMNLALGELDTLHLSLTYRDDPTALYHTLCGDRAHSLLLESAEIATKQAQKSLMLVDAALRIHCLASTITLSALSNNGQNLIRLIERALPVLGDAIAKQETQMENGYCCLILTLAPVSRALDEDARLHQPSVLSVLRLLRTELELRGHRDEALFVGGIFGYDLVASFEPLPEVARRNQCPDYLFFVAETLLVLDHQSQKMHLQGTIFGGEQVTENYFELSRRIQQLSEQAQLVTALPKAQQVAMPSVQTDISDAAFCDTVEKLKSHVVAGDIFQVVPSRTFSLPCPSPLQAYHALKQRNPSPYMFYLQDRDFTLFGASPESALKYSQQSNQVEIYPIAGTRPRGKNSDGSINFDLDGRIELELRSDKKELAEHMMLVDLARNDVARISSAGSRHVADLLKVDRYSHVMHLVSRVVGQLQPKLDALHAYQACMNMGTLSGAPKIRAMQLIREVEQKQRGSYGGAVGYLTGAGDMDTCIVIRSAYVENEIAYVQAGAGVVYDSQPQAEADETRAKAQAVLSAITAAHA
ncbi:Anthranilate synthase component 1 [Vibrio stylophorae]|uniref:Anthranilate synthase component 1 n=1 Tax=Vibrio stylophorae TaxID=659351 RepID=A0ABM8ZRQ6_9VIBR|nr:anthranilate synthase component 1 [Vibrio stylophorae]CAH0532985.1 Anthranilate synthase component 1 [Vibrio stylophorae]